MCISDVRQTERVSARVPAHIYEKLMEAAGMVGASINQFLIQSALEKAETIIERERAINLTRRDAEFFFNAVENPALINEKLSKAMQSYNEAFPDAENRGTLSKA